MGGGVESPHVIDCPGVEELPQWEETSGVPTKGERVPGEDGQRQGGDRTPPTTQVTEARGGIGGDKERMCGTVPAAVPIPQRVTAADGDSAGTHNRHPNSADGARPQNGMQSRREYGLLAPEEPTVDPAVAGTQVRQEGHGATRETDDEG